MNFALLPYIPYLAITLVLGYIIYKANSDPSTFSVKQYFSDDTGKASTPKTLQVIAGIVASIVVVKAELAGTLTDSLFGIYLAALGVSEGFARYIESKRE